MQVSVWRSTIGVFVLSAGALAQAPVVQSPLRAAPPAPGLGRPLAVDEAAVRALARTGERRIRMRDVPTADGRLVELELERVEPQTSRTELLVDGARVTGGVDTAGLSMWRGRVAGDADSEAFLGFSPHGTRGWLREGGQRSHFLAGPDPVEGWRAPRCTVVAEASLEQHGASRPFHCELPPAGGLWTPNSSQFPGLRERDGDPLGPRPVLECKVAFETDFQLYEQFDDLDALEDYVIMLLTAVSMRYEEQLETVITPIYLAFYTTPADPWTTQDTGGMVDDLLAEFRSASIGNLPVESDVAHFLSGAPLGGGLAWVNMLCNPAFGFGVSSHITLLGMLPGGPLMQGPLTWDFFVVAHELGHNFGARHTDEYFPPIDDCPGTCISDGTIMSYCHLCPGGLSNVTTYFHPRVVEVMRRRADDCCERLGTESLGVVYCDPAQPNAAGLPGHLSVTGSANVLDDDLTLRARWLPLVSNVGYFLMGTGSNVFTPPGAASPICVAPGLVRFADPPNYTDEGPMGFRRKIGTSGPRSSLIRPGSVWNFQAWYRDQNAGNCNFTNAVSVTFQ